MMTIKKPGQVGHIDGGLVAVAAMDFVECERILTGEIRAPGFAEGRLVVIGGSTGKTSVALARQDTGEDLHVPMMSAVYVNARDAFDVHMARSGRVYRYADEAEGRGQLRLARDLRTSSSVLAQHARRLLQLMTGGAAA